MKATTNTTQTKINLDKLNFKNNKKNSFVMPVEKAEHSELFIYLRFDS